MKHIQNYIAGLAVVAFGLPVLAGGYQLNDYSVTGLGRAYAGQGIMGDDYSAIAFNPAGMAAVKRSGIQTGLTMINIKADVDSLDSRHPGAHKKMNFWAPIPQVFGQYNVNDRLSLGLGVYAPFGLKTQYKADWYGSDTAILSKLDIIDINLAASYKVTPQWTVGAGVIARYIYGHMTNSVPTMIGGAPLGGGTSDFELDGWTKTGLFGVMYEPTENTRFGLSYRLRSTQQVKGDHKVKDNHYPALNGTYTGRASPALPETITFSAYHRYKKVGFSGTARWTHWSQSFPEFVMKSDSPLLRALPAPSTPGEKRSLYNYGNTWTLTAGLDYYYNENWTFRCGTGWDESPTHSNDTRTIRIPDNDRFWLSAGASYMQKNWQVDVGYGHMFGRTGKALETSDPSATKVKYKNLQSYLFGLQVQYKF